MSINIVVVQRWYVAIFAVLVLLASAQDAFARGGRGGRGGHSHGGHYHGRSSAGGFGGGLAALLIVGALGIGGMKALSRSKRPATGVGSTSMPHTNATTA